MREIMTLILVVLFCISLVGCTTQADNNQEEPIICGGVIDYTDQNAPKEIISKNIVEFSTSFFIYDKYDEEKDGIYDIEIVDNENGEHVLTVKGVYNHDMLVDDSVLVDVQAIIDKYELVKNNGAGEVTSGLAPEWGPWKLRVTYDSGEKLYFYENGSPEADWTAEFRDYFVGVMTKAGFEDVLVPKEAMTIEKFSFAFDIDEEYHFYGLTSISNESTFLWHYALDMDTQEETQSEFAVVTDGLYEGLQDVIIEYGMDALHAPESVNFDLASSKDGFLEIYIDYVSGRQIYGEYEASELPKEWHGMKLGLVEFMDKYIRENSGLRGRNI